MKLGLMVAHRAIRRVEKDELRLNISELLLFFHDGGRLLRRLLRLTTSLGRNLAQLGEE